MIARSILRLALLALVTAFSAPAWADACASDAAQIAASTGAQPDRRSPNVLALKFPASHPYGAFRLGLQCADELSDTSVELYADEREPPTRFFELVAVAGSAVTSETVPALREASLKCLAALRKDGYNGQVALPGAKVTCHGGDVPFWIDVDPPARR